MPQFTLNGTTVELVPQDRDAFNWLASQVYRKLFADKAPPLPGLLAMLALDAPRQGVALTDPRAQAVMWTIYQLGFDKVALDEAAQQVKWDKGEHTNVGTKPFIDHFTEEGVRDGRALAAALSAVMNRSIRVNGREMPVRINDFELLKAQAEEMKKRHDNANADLSLAAARYVAELLAQGVEDHDLRLRAALELAADLGVRSMEIDPAARQVRLDSFNEVSCLAAAFFQNVPVEQFAAAIKRAQALNAAAAENNRKAAAQATAQGRRGAEPVGAGQGGQTVNLTFKRRRR